MTSYKSIKTDVINAGAKWEDCQVVVDQGVITSRNPGGPRSVQREDRRRGQGRPPRQAGRGLATVLLAVVA
jgi:putative intracellular protease/amidase